jgi:hypothetical protein
MMMPFISKTAILSEPEMIVGPVDPLIEKKIDATSAMIKKQISTKNDTKKIVNLFFINPYCVNNIS